jgi:hypothetical protein
LRARAINSSLPRIVAIPLPIIALMDVGACVLLAKATAERVLIADPATQQPRILPIAAFAANWTGQLILAGKRAGLSDVTRYFDINWFLSAIHKYRSILIEALSPGLLLQALKPRVGILCLPSVTRPRYYGPMSEFFDATITIGHHHLIAAGLDPRQSDGVVDAVRSAVRRMDVANWIDVEAADFPPTCPGGVTVYPRGHSITPDTPQWLERRRQVEASVRAALIAVAARSAV